MPPPRDLKKYTPRSFDEDGNETTTKIAQLNVPIEAAAAVVVMKE